jgi:tetratricopeptide (TPR) repeat protein
LIEALNELATLLESKGKVDEARPYRDRVRKLGEQRSDFQLAVSANSRGLDLMKEEKLNEALKAFTEALLKDPSYAAAAYNQGLVLARMNQLPDAAQAFRTAIRLRPGFALAHFGLGLVLKAQDNPAAEEELQKARALTKLVNAKSGGSEAQTSK